MSSADSESRDPPSPGSACIYQLSLIVGKFKKEAIVARTQTEGSSPKGQRVLGAIYKPTYLLFFSALTLEKN